MTAELHALNADEPHNELAENSIIGSLLHDNALVERYVVTLRPEDFYEPLLGKLFAAIVDLQSKHQRADYRTLAPIIRNEPLYGLDVLNYVSNLTSQAADTPEQLYDYVQQVLQFSAQRELISIGRDLCAQVNKVDGVSLEEIYDGIVKRMDDAVARTTSRKVTSLSARAAMEAMLADYDCGPTAVKTRIGPLDSATGGLGLGELSIVAGRPGCGKTAFALQVALNVARSGQGVGFCSLEMPHVPLAQRLASSLAYRGEDQVTNGVVIRPSDSIPYNSIRLKKLTQTQRQIVREQLTKLEDVPLIIDTASAVTVSQITALARRWQTEFAAQGKPFALLVVDYLGLIELSTRWGDNRAYAIGAVTAALKDLAKRLNVHVMALHQLNREVEKTNDKRPHMHHLRESGSIEQDADLILLPFRKAYYLERETWDANAGGEQARLAELEKCRTTMDLIVEKNRMGSTGSYEVFCSIANNFIATPDPHHKPE